MNFSLSKTQKKSLFNFFWLKIIQYFISYPNRNSIWDSTWLDLSQHKNKNIKGGEKIDVCF